MYKQLLCVLKTFQDSFIGIQYRVGMYDTVGVYTKEKLLFLKITKMVVQ